MATDVATLVPHAQLGEINKSDFRTESEAIFKARKGLDVDIVPLVKELPREYAVEMNRLIQLQMEGTVG